MQTRLELRAVRKAYPDHVVLDQCELQLPAGSVHAIRGASGTGKSTLLNIAGLLDRPDSGSVHLDGSDCKSLGNRQRALLRAQRIGFVFQGFHLLPEFTVLENVLLAARCAGHTAKALQPRAQSLLDRVGLHKLAARSIGGLSGGERQRVALCRALLLRPGLILADEPTGNLDPATGSQVLNCLLELAQEEQAAVLIVTHDPQVAARCQAVHELRAGRLVSGAS